MRNAFVAGLRHAAGALLGIVLFLEEFGPVLLIWAVILGDSDDTDMAQISQG